MGDYASQRIAELRDKLDRIDSALASIRSDVVKLERSKRAPSRVAVDRVSDLCLKVSVGALEISRELGRGSTFKE